METRRICKVCKKEFTYKQSRGPPPKYCSDECRNSARQLQWRDSQRCHRKLLKRLREDAYKELRKYAKERGLHHTEITLPGEDLGTPLGQTKMLGTIESKNGQRIRGWIKLERAITKIRWHEKRIAKKRIKKCDEEFESWRD